MDIRTGDTVTIYWDPTPRSVVAIDNNKAWVTSPKSATTLGLVVHLSDLRPYDPPLVAMDYQHLRPGQAVWKKNDLNSEQYWLITIIRTDVHRRDYEYIAVIAPATGFAGDEEVYQGTIFSKPRKNQWDG